MLSNIKNLLAIPPFDNPGEARVAYLLRSITIIMMVLGAIISIIAFIVDRDLSSLLIGVALIGFAAILLALIKNRQIKAASLLLPTTILVAATANAILFNGIQDTGISSLILVVAIAALLLGGNAALVFAGLTIAASLIVYIVHPSPVPTPLEWFVLAAVLTISGFLFRYAVDALNSALSQAEQKEYEIAAVNAQLERANAELEARVLSRTRLIADATQISRSISAILSIEELLSVVPRLINDHLGYHASLELGDASPQVEVTPNRVSIPITAKDKYVAVGQLVVIHQGGFDSSSVDVLQTIAHQISVTLQTIEYVTAAANRATQEALLAHITGEIARTTSIEEAMQVAVREVGRATGAPQTRVMLTPGKQE